MAQFLFRNMASRAEQFVSNNELGNKVFRKKTLKPSKPDN